MQLALWRRLVDRTFAVDLSGEEHEEGDAECAKGGSHQQRETHRGEVRVVDESASSVHRRDVACNDGIRWHVGHERAVQSGSV